MPTTKQTAAERLAAPITITLTPTAVERLATHCTTRDLVSVDGCKVTATRADWTGRAVKGALLKLSAPIWENNDKRRLAALEAATWLGAPS